MRWAESPREVAGESEVVFSIVTDATAVKSVALGDNGIIAGLHKGGVYLDMSTIAPDASRAVAAEFAKAGLTMLDAPISGSTATLAEGKASIMVGGDQAAFERVQPVLLAIGPKVTYIGASGLAVQMKLAINLVLMVEVIAFCEGVALAEKGGVAREVAVDAMLKSVVASPVLGYRGPVHPRRKNASGAAGGREPAAEGHVAGARAGAQAGHSGSARGGRKRNDERVPRPRHRSPRLCHRA